MKKIDNRAKLILALGVVAVFIIAAAYLLFQPKRVSVTLPYGEAGDGETNFALDSLFRGSGCWITKATVDNNFVTSGVFDWYVATDKVLQNSNFPAIKKPLILALGFGEDNPINEYITKETVNADPTVKKLKAQIDIYRQKFGNQLRSVFGILNILAMAHALKRKKMPE